MNTPMAPAVRFVVEHIAEAAHADRVAGSASGLKAAHLMETLRQMAPLTADRTAEFLAATLDDPGMLESMVSTWHEQITEDGTLAGSHVSLALPDLTELETALAAALFIPVNPGTAKPGAGQVTLWDQSYLRIAKAIAPFIARMLIETQANALAAAATVFENDGINHVEGTEGVGEWLRTIATDVRTDQRSLT